MTLAAAQSAMHGCPPQLCDTGKSSLCHAGQLRLAAKSRRLLVLFGRRYPLLSAKPADVTEIGKACPAPLAVASPLPMGPLCV